MKIKNRHLLKNSEIKEISQSLENKFGFNFFKNRKVERGEIGDREFLLIDGEPLLSKFEDVFFPNVKGALKFNLEKNYLTVDQGAVPYVINGADIMAPGVVDVDYDLIEGDLAIVMEEEHNKPFAVVRLIKDGADILELDKGKVAKNIHHIRDELWEKID
ncbi:RNA-binding protein [archaeon SCG-AAA382B04]|nr:RNA-binding protein [archaeon SCG-AAA382B04]